jgi:hypothetical protein
VSESVGLGPVALVLGSVLCCEQQRLVVNTTCVRVDMAMAAHGDILGLAYDGCTLYVCDVVNGVWKFAVVGLLQLGSQSVSVRGLRTAPWNQNTP